MTHPYNNIASSSILPLPQPQSRLTSCSQKTDFLKKCKYILDFHQVEQEMIEAHLERHRIAWDVIYPCNSKPYTPPETFTKHLASLKKQITELQYRYTVIEMFL